MSGSGNDNDDDRKVLSDDRFSSPMKLIIDGIVEYDPEHPENEGKPYRPRDVIAELRAKYQQQPKQRKKHIHIWRR